jgi:hypothetical protein
VEERESRSRMEGVQWSTRTRMERALMIGEVGRLAVTLLLIVIKRDCEIMCQ